MSKVPSTTPTHTAIEAFLTKPPLLSTESRPAYEAMRRALEARLNPQDENERMLVDDYLYCCIQIRRWRKFGSTIIDTMRKDALRALLESIQEGQGEERSNVIKEIAAWFKDEEGKDSGLKILGAYGMDENHVTAQAMSLCLSELNAAERTIGDLERRRKAAIQDLEYYRASAFWRSPKNLPAVIDAAPDTVPALNADEAAAGGGNDVQ